MGKWLKLAGHRRLAVRIKVQKQKEWLKPFCYLIIFNARFSYCCKPVIIICGAIQITDFHIEILHCNRLKPTKIKNLWKSHVESSKLQQINTKTNKKIKVVSTTKCSSIYFSIYFG